MVSMCEVQVVWSSKIRNKTRFWFPALEDSLIKISVSRDDDKSSLAIRFEKNTWSFLFVK